MEENEDWKELEKWNEDMQSQKKEEYGMDLSQMKQQSEKMEKVIKKVSVGGKFLIAIFIIITIIVLYRISIIAYISFSNMKSSYNIDVKKDIETSHFVKVELISKDTTKYYGLNNENGIFYFKIKKLPDVKFTVLKHASTTFDDYDENFQKYLFEHWNDNEKSNFKTEEYIQENGLLFYKNYIEAQNYDEVMQATEYVIHFLEYVENWNKENKIIRNYIQKKGEFAVAPTAMIYIKTKEKIILPYSGVYSTSDNIREEVKRQCTQIF